MPRTDEGAAVAKPDVQSWLFKMFVAMIGIGLTATLAETMLASAGFVDGLGLMLVGIVCGVTAARMPEPVADPFLQWRVGFWAARWMAPWLLTVDPVFGPLLPSWGLVLLTSGLLWASVLAVAWKIDRWSRQRSQDQAQQEADQ